MPDHGTGTDGLTCGSDFTRAWNDSWICNVCTHDAIDSPSMTAQAAMDHERTEEHLSHSLNHHDHRSHAPWELFEHSALTYEGLKVREQRWQIDHVRDIVPWWVRAVEAAERGESWKMEDLLASIPDDPWGSGGDDEDPWGGGWGTGDALNRNDWADEIDRWGGKVSEGEWNHSHPLGEWDARDSFSSLHAPRTLTASDAGRNRRRKEGIVRRIEEDHTFKGSGLKHQRNMYRFAEDIANREAADEGRKRRMHLFLEVLTFFFFLPFPCIGQFQTVC